MEAVVAVAYAEASIGSSQEQASKPKKRVCYWMNDAEAAEASNVVAKMFCDRDVRVAVVAGVYCSDVAAV